MQKTIFIVVMLIMILSLSLHADIYMVQKERTEGGAMMGRTGAAEEVTQKIWITENKIKNENDDQTIIILLDEKKIISINHEEKTYSEMPMEFDKVMEKAMQNQSEEDRQGMEQYMQMAKGMGKFELKVTPTSETKKIKKWNCKKYNQEKKMSMGPIVSEIWATEDLKADFEVMAKLRTAMMSMQPGFDGFEKVEEEMKKIKGVPVYSESTMNIMGMKMKTIQELIEFKEATAPAGTFDIPKGYKKVDMQHGF